MNAGTMSRTGLKVMATRLIQQHGQERIDMLTLAEAVGGLLSADELDELSDVVRQAKVTTTISWPDDPKPLTINGRPPFGGWQ